MSGKAARVVITERQQVVLQQLSRSTTVAFRLRQRAQLILLAFEKRLNRDIAATVQLGTNQVGAWRKRWQQEFDRLTLIEGIEEPIELRRAIEDVLSDEQRSGRPTTFTAEQLTMIFAVACEAVEESGRPVARWTQREIIDEVIRRGIVDSISTSHMSTLLAEAQLQPHKSRYWLNTKWLNQVEIWFSVVVRRVIQRSNFTSVEALRQRLMDFIDYFNRTMAKPYRWTFTGQPLTI